MGAWVRGATAGTAGGTARATACFPVTPACAYTADCTRCRSASGCSCGSTGSGGLVRERASAGLEGDRRQRRGGQRRAGVAVDDPEPAGPLNCPVLAGLRDLLAG